MGLPHKETQNLPPGGGGGYWVCIIDQDHHYDFMKDTDWKAQANYNRDDWINGQITKWMGAKIFGHTQPWRETVAGAEAETSGVVHPLYFLAQDAYAISPIADPKAEGDFGTLITIKEPTDFGDWIQIKSSMSWQTYAVWRMLNSLWCIVMLAGSTA
jgi:N4-gp56 family major capsid protein